MNNKERILEIINKSEVENELILELEYLLKLEAYNQYEIMIKKLPLYNMFDKTFDNYLKKVKTGELEFEELIRIISEWSSNNKNYYSIGGDGFEKLGMTIVGK